jgi:hypothetical protein
MWPHTIGLLGALCCANAILAWHVSSYRLNVAWFIDGILKLRVGAMMLFTAPVLRMAFGR